MDKCRCGCVFIVAPSRCNYTTTTGEQVLSQLYLKIRDSSRKHIKLTKWILKLAKNTTRNSQTSSWLYTHVSICIQHRAQTHYIISQHLANKKVCPILPFKLKKKKYPPKTSLGNLSFHTFIFSKATPI